MILQAAAPTQDASLFTIEGALTVICVGLAFCLPRLGSPAFSRIEQVFGQLARRKGLSVAVVGVTALLLRLAILPFCPIPLPFVPDDFSFLLAADTFAHGHLTNPTPAMWIHFESIHITMNPTYMSMYFPSTGLVLAASQLLFGHPWFGILIMTALMCAAICWMLQAWLPPSWALLGGFLAILRLGLFSYWINTYSGGGSIAALGGALVLGAYPRLIKTFRLREGFLLAIGVVLVGTTRPYEGLLLCLPVAIALGHWMFFGKNRPATSLILRNTAGPILVLVAAGLWMGYYDQAAFGKATTLPYTVDRATYAVAPYYVWQKQRSDPGYNHESLRRFYYDNELKGYSKIHSASGFLPETSFKVARAILFFTGLAFLPLVFQVRRVLLDRRIRFLVLGLVLFGLGMLIEIYLIPHYLAPFTAAFYAVGLQAIRHIWVSKPGGQPVGKTLIRLSVSLCVLMMVARLYAQPLHMRMDEWPPSAWTDKWFGPGYFGTERADIEKNLESQPGRQLVLVRYSPKHNPIDEWVYNLSNIDGQKVIWAREMDSAHNQELMAYYRDRKVWLVEPDKPAKKLSIYPVVATELPGSQMTAAIQGIRKPDMKGRP